MNLTNLKKYSYIDILAVLDNNKLNDNERCILLRAFNFEEVKKVLEYYINKSIKRRLVKKYINDLYINDCFYSDGSVYYEYVESIDNKTNISLDKLVVVVNLSKSLESVIISRRLTPSKNFPQELANLLSILDKPLPASNVVDMFLINTHYNILNTYIKLLTIDSLNQEEELKQFENASKHLTKYLKRFGSLELAKNIENIKYKRITKNDIYDDLKTDSKELCNILFENLEQKQSKKLNFINKYFKLLKTTLKEKIKSK